MTPSTKEIDVIREFLSYGFAPDERIRTSCIKGDYLHKALPDGRRVHQSVLGAWERRGWTTRTGKGEYLVLHGCPEEAEE